MILWFSHVSKLYHTEYIYMASLQCVNQMLLKTTISQKIITLVAFIWFLPSVCHQMLLKATISQKRFPPIYIASPLQQGANHITNNLLFFLPQKWHFWFLIIEIKILFYGTVIFLWNWFEIFQCIYMIFSSMYPQMQLQIIFMWENFHNDCIYMGSLQCVSSDVA